MKDVVVLVGASASGKTTIEKALVDTGSYIKAVSDTTRPIREGEVEGEDYYFIDKKTFEKSSKKGLYVEKTKYNGWFYGVRASELENKDKKTVVVLSPHGFRQVKDNKELNITSFYVDVGWRTRAKRLIDRGDDMMEIFRRTISDIDVFQGISSEVDFIIDNDDGKNIDEVVLNIGEKISFQK